MTFTRRRFTCRLLSASSAGLITGGFRTSGQEQVSTEKDLDVGKYIYKSLKWNMVRVDGSLLDKFQMLKKLGYDGVELECPAELNWSDAKEASEKTQLPIEGIVNSTHWRIRHSDPDPKVRDEAFANMRLALETAAKVGADSVLLVPGKVTDPENENHDQVWTRSTREILRLIPIAKKLRVQILIENVGNGFCESPELFAQYVDQFESEWVGIHFDIGNHIRISPPADWIRVLDKRIKKLDVKDRTRANERTLIGDGEAQWAAVRKALKEIGYRGWAAAEVSGGDEQRLADVLARMNRVLGVSDGKHT